MITVWISGRPGSFLMGTVRNKRAVTYSWIVIITLRHIPGIILGSNTIISSFFVHLCFPHLYSPMLQCKVENMVFQGNKQISNVHQIWEKNPSPRTEVWDNGRYLFLSMMDSTCVIAKHQCESQIAPIISTPPDIYFCVCFGWSHRFFCHCVCLNLTIHKNIENNTTKSHFLKIFSVFCFANAVFLLHPDVTKHTETLLACSRYTEGVCVSESRAASVYLQLSIRHREQVCLSNSTCLGWTRPPLIWSSLLT